MWMCEEAYFASPDIKELARHSADYGYMFDDPGPVVVNEAGEVAQSLFKTPPVEWVAERLFNLKQVLEGEPTASALTLRQVLGPVKLIPVVPQVGRSYYKAETASRLST